MLTQCSNNFKFLKVRSENLNNKNSMYVQQANVYLTRLYKM